MSSKRILNFTMNSFVLIVVLAAQVSCNPRDLVEEVQEQLDQLRSIVQGEILVAHSGLDEIENNFIAFSNILLLESIFSMQLKKQEIEEQLTTLKNLANAANKDISSCTDVREEVFDHLQAEYESQLYNYCITGNMLEEATIVQDAKYLIDVAINKVHSYEFQLGACRGDTVCISPLVTEIELDKIRLPENIQTELSNAEDRVNLLSSLTQQCSDAAMSNYIAHTSVVVREITNCVEAILN